MAFRGAGAILYTSLVKDGYRLSSNYILSEEEERHIYEQEVLLRLGKNDCAAPLMDLLVDLPPEAILSCSGLLEAMIDFIGGGPASHSGDLQSTDFLYQQHDLAFTPAISEDRHDGLGSSFSISSPLFGLDWCERLLQLVIDQFAVLLRGFMCSSTSDLINKADAHNQESASYMLQRMLMKRHPSLGGAKDESTKRQVPLAGFAFSCCAAVLPLFLQSKEPSLLWGVSRLLRRAIPLVLEPSKDRLAGMSVELGEVEVGRLQHLLRRFEQIFNFYECLPSLPFSGSGGATSQEEQFSVAIIGALREILSLIPSPEALAQTGSESNPPATATAALAVDLGPNVLEIVKRLCLLEESKLNENERSHLDSLLSAADPDSSSQIMGIRGVCAASLRYIQLLDSGDAASTDELFELSSTAIGFAELDYINSSAAQSAISTRIATESVYLFATGLTMSSVGSDKFVSTILRLILCKNKLYSTRALEELLAVLSDGSKSSIKSELAQRKVAAPVDIGVILSSLTSPFFMRAMLTLAVILISRKEHESAALIAAMKILKHLADFLMSDGRLFSATDGWICLLYPLQLLIQLLGEDSFHREELSSISALAAVFKDASLSSVAHTSAMLKGTAVGVFSLHQGTRQLARCSLKGLLSPHMLDSLEVKTDPFPARSAVRLQSYAGGSCSSKATPENMRSTYIHDEWLKLATVAFGNYDDSVKGVALRQLRLRLGERPVLASADSDSILSLASSCLGVVDELDWDDIGSTPPHSCEIYLGCASLLELLIVGDKRVRDALLLCRHATAPPIQGALCANALLRPFLANTYARPISSVSQFKTNDQRPRSFKTAGSQEGGASEAFHASSWDVLKLVLGRALTAWALHGDNLDLSQTFDDCCISIKHARDIGLISIFLHEQLGAVVLSPGHISRSDPALSIYISGGSLTGDPAATGQLDFEVSTVSDSSLHYFHFVSEKFDWCGLDSSEPVAGPNSLSEARTHLELQSAMFAARTSLLYAAAPSGVHVRHVQVLVSRILAVPPSTQKDLATLVVALPYIADVLQQYSSELLVDSNIDLVLRPTLHAVLSILSATLNANFVVPSQPLLIQTEVQLLYARLLRSFQLHYGAVFGDEWREGVVANSIPQNLVRLLCSENLSSFARTFFASVLEDIVPYSEVRTALGGLKQSNSSFASSADTPRSLVDAVAHTAFLLRSLDSSKRTGCIQGCLRVLIAVLSHKPTLQVKLDLQPLLRMSCDRRSATRYLALVLLEKVCSLSPAAIDAEAAIQSTRAITKDRTECHAVRLVSARISSKATQASVPDLTSVLTCCLDICDESGSALSLSAECLAPAADLAYELLDRLGLEDARAVAKGSRILPILLPFLQPSAYPRLLDCGLIRVFFFEPKTFFGRGRAREASASPLGKVWKHFQSSELQNVLDAQSSITRLLHRFVTGRTAESAPVITPESVSFIDDIWRNFCLIGKLKISRGGFARRASFCCMADVLSGTCDGNSGLTSGESLDTVYEFLCEAHTCMSDGNFSFSVYKTINSSLRLLSTMLQYKSQLEAIDEVFAVLVRSQLLLRDSTALITSFNKTSLIYSIDIVLATILQQSSSACKLLSTPGSIFTELIELSLKDLVDNISQCMKSPREADSQTGIVTPSKTKSNGKKMVSPHSVADISQDISWRSKTRQFEVRETAQIISSRNVLSDVALQAVHGSLLVIQHAMKGYESARDISLNAGIAEVLASILRLGANWALASKSTSKLPESPRRPSHADIVSAAMGCIAVILAETRDARNLSRTASRSLALRGGPPSSGASVTYLMHLSASKEIHPDVRLLSNAVLADYLRCEFAAVPNQHLLEVFNSELDKALHTSKAAAAKRAYLLAEARFAIGHEFENVGCTSLRPVDILELIQLNYSANEEMLDSAVRAIGRLTTHASKKVRAGVSSHESVGFVHFVISSCSLKATFLSGIITLWSLCNAGEESKYLVRASRYRDRDVLECLDYSPIIDTLYSDESAILDSLRSFLAQ